MPNLPLTTYDLICLTLAFAGVTLIGKSIGNWIWVKFFFRTLTEIRIRKELSAIEASIKEELAARDSKISFSMSEETETK